MHPPVIAALKKNNDERVRRSEMSSGLHTVLRVTRTKAQAKESYDKMSPFYDYFAGLFEQKYRNVALKRLNITRGETVLEIGFGTGHCLKQMAEAVGEEGRVYGIDISSGMLVASRRRLEKAGLWNRVELTCDDAMKMPYADNKFDAVFTSFALELFDSPEIPQVLAEIRRVLRPNGRVGVISMSKEDGASPLLKLYEWLHQKLPQYVDCRPIYVEQSIKDAGFGIQYKERVSLLGLPGDIVIGTKPASSV
jgi:demethylmenaquinone methyltransferase/2-methoxy-6-polyprenyl-1,4-benzoquinol methylase